MYFVFFLYLARKSEIIRSTELLLDAISSNDFESYAYVEFANSHIRVLHFRASLVGKVNVPNFQNLLLTENLNRCWVLQIIKSPLLFSDSVYYRKIYIVRLSENIGLLSYYCTCIFHMLFCMYLTMP